MADQKHYEIYQEIEETADPQQKARYWKTGFGLNKIDYLEPLDYLTKTLLPDHFAGKLTYQEVENALVNHYQTLPMDNQNLRDRECDIVSTRIASLLDNSGFVLNPASLKGIASFTSSIWQVHPFREGDTRTVAVFMVQYLKVLGFKVNNDPFEENASYFRNALVWANYTNQALLINHTDVYLVKFFENLLNHTDHLLLDQEEIE